MGVPVREWTHWAVGYAPSRAALNLLARRGDPRRPVQDHQTSGSIVFSFRPVDPGQDRPPRAQPDRAAVDVGLRSARAHAAAPPGLPRIHAQALERLRSRVHNLADELLCGLKGKTECDLVAEYTSRIPIAIITEMMGMPPDETGYLQEVAAAITRLIGGTAASWRDFRAGTAVLREFDRYLANHIERLRKDDTGDSILSDVVRSGDLTEIELRMLANLLLGAGFVTTSHVMGKAVVALVRHPDQLAALSANPDGWPGAVEEILRYDTAGHVVPRIATEDVDVQGYLVRTDEPVFLLAGGANRDPALFDNPGTFDTARANAREHLSFSTGSHVCFGAALARMELHIGLHSLFEHFPELTIAGEPTYNNSIGLHGLTHLPVSLRPAQSMRSTH
jgi:cytochrome P450